MGRCRFEGCCVQGKGLLLHLLQGIIGECVCILVSNFPKVPVTCQHSNLPGSLLQVECVWNLARQPICIVSRDTGYLPKNRFGLRRLRIHESQRTNCRCCGLDREGQWCLWSTSGSLASSTTSFHRRCFVHRHRGMSRRQLVDFQISRKRVHLSISCGPMSMRPTALCWS